MLVEKIRYYLKTSADKRAADRAEYNALVSRCARARVGADMAFDAITHRLERLEQSYSVCACIKYQKIDSVIDAPFFGSSPAPIVLRDQCWFFEPERTCCQMRCANHANNRMYFVKQRRYEELENAKKYFWSRKYANVK